MFHNFEQSMTQNEKKLKELLLKNEALDREVSALLKEETLKKVAAYSQDKGNFSEEEWESLQKERKDFEVKLRRELDQVQNPRRTSARCICHHASGCHQAKPASARSPTPSIRQREGLMGIRRRSAVSRQPRLRSTAA